jgi:hypothetical protein
VARVQLQEPYRELIGALEPIVCLTDDTDVNEDVCFRYIINANGGADENVLLLSLSMVGPYAIFERAVEDSQPVLIFAKADCATTVERSILRLLARHGLVAMSAEHLSFRPDMELPDIDHPTAYNVLFAPDEQGSH